MKKITLIQSSLRENSNTSIVCTEFVTKAIEAWLDVSYIDLRESKLQFCDGRLFEDYNDDMQDAYKTMEESEVIIFGMPVYQYSMSGVLKNFIDVCGWALSGKYIGAIVNAWGPNCYMASRDLFDCLYFEYATKSLAPTPYSWSMDFSDGELINDQVHQKIDELIANIWLLK